MIKGISILRPTGNAAAYERLSSFFTALGFAPAKDGRKRARVAHRSGPLANLEFVDGRFPQVADSVAGRSPHRSHIARLPSIQGGERGCAPMQFQTIRGRGGQPHLANTETHWNRASSPSSPSPVSVLVSGRGPTR